MRAIRLERVGRRYGNTAALEDVSIDIQDHEVVTIVGPSGCGKSTLVEQMEQLFTWLGVTAASVSIDDFYLTNAGDWELLAANVCTAWVVHVLPFHT